MAETPPPDRPAADPRLLDRTVGALRRRLTVEQADNRLPSVAAGVVRDGRLVWADAVGALDGRPTGPPATPSRQYRLGSITKTLVAVEVLRLRDEGRLDLADSIRRHLDADGLPDVTVAQLLTHTSGLPAENDGEWWERAPGPGWATLRARSLEPRHTPGTRFHYSNVGYGVLGVLIERLRTVPWDEAVLGGIAAPLGLRNTTTRPLTHAAPGLAVHPEADLVHAEPEHDAGAMAPAGQLWSDIPDLARWAAFLAGSTGGVLAPGTLTEMLRPVAVSDTPAAPWTTAHGLGWQVWNVDGRRYAGHGGSMPGFLAQLRVDLETGDGAVVLTNSTHGLAPLAAGLLDTLAEVEPAEPAAWVADAGQARNLDLVGAWCFGVLRMDLRLTADGLTLGVLGEGRGSRFVTDDDAADDRSGDAWTGVDGYFAGEPLRVDRDAAGVPVRLRVASFVFTRAPYPPGTDVPGGLDERSWH